NAIRKNCAVMYFALAQLRTLAISRERSISLSTNHLLQLPSTDLSPPRGESPAYAPASSAQSVPMFLDCRRAAAFPSPTSRAPAVAFAPCEPLTEACFLLKKRSMSMDEEKAAAFQRELAKTEIVSGFRKALDFRYRAFCQ